MFVNHYQLYDFKILSRANEQLNLLYLEKYLINLSISFLLRKNNTHAIHLQICLVQQGISSHEVEGQFFIA